MATNPTIVVAAPRHDAYMCQLRSTPLSTQRSAKQRVIVCLVCLPVGQFSLCNNCGFPPELPKSVLRVSWWLVLLIALWLRVYNVYCVRISVLLTYLADVHALLTSQRIQWMITHRATVASVIATDYAASHALKNRFQKSVCRGDPSENRSP